jgi:hypothetical protein
MEENTWQLHELHLPQQLFVQQQHINKFSNSTSWQKSDKSTGESNELAKWSGK